MRFIRILLLCIVALFAINAHAASFGLTDIYSEGTVLRYAMGDYFGRPSDDGKIGAFHTYEFYGVKEFAGKEYLALSEIDYLETGEINRAKTPNGYYRIEGNKVYSHPVAEDCQNIAVDYPMYDFDLQPGDLVILNSGHINKTALEEGDLMWVKCLDRRSVVIGGQEVEEIEVHYIGPVKMEGALKGNFDKAYTLEEAMEYECPAIGKIQIFGNDVWIAGIGAKLGLANMQPWSLCVGGFVFLQSVTKNGNEVYIDPKVELPTAAISLPNEDTDNSAGGKQYRLDGTRHSHGEKGIYIQEGKKILIR